MKLKTLLSFLSCLSAALHAQQVTFTYQPNLLNPIFGFAYSNCAVDMNGDFLDDVVRVAGNGLYIDYQQPDGTFSQKFFPVGFQNEPDWSICAGDLDNNGWNDLLFGGSSFVSFVKANADGTAYSEEVAPDWIFSQRSTMADINNDGWLDAFVCHDVDQSIPFRNDGAGNMITDYSLIETADRPGNYAAIWTDYDNDGDSDLYITKCEGGAPPGDIDRTNLLYRNNGDGTFSEVGAQAGVNDNAQSWSTVFEDFDNDGDMDAFIVNHDFANRFYRNNGDGTFTDIINLTGIDPFDLGAWENSAGDFNNDGFVDIFTELFNELYLNNGPDPVLGITFTGQSLPVTPGAIADFNNDGFLDVVANAALWINNGNDNNWLKVNTVGTLSNRNGIGARIEIYGDWGIQVREVRSGESFSPMHSLTEHFGLGQADHVDLVVVKWPSGMVTTVANPVINTTINVPEANCLLPPSELSVSGETNICPGDSVVLTAPGGFNYIWSNGDTTQSIVIKEAGEFSAYLSDTAGCVSLSNKVTITLTVESSPVIEIEGSTIFCEGGAVKLTSSPGTNYQWSNGMTEQSITVTQPGDYTVSVDGSCSGLPLSSLPVKVIVLPAPDPVVMGAAIGVGDSILLFRCR